MMSNREHDSYLHEIERKNRTLERELLRSQQSLRLLQEIQRGNSNILSSLLHGIESEKEKSDRLLRNILPEQVIQRLNQGETTIADSVESASVVFADFVGFTPISAQMSALELVKWLNDFYTRFDEAAQRIGVEKIKTIGDAYLAASGLNGDREDHPAMATEFALAIRGIVKSRNDDDCIRWQIRTGVHSGSLTAGVIGQHKFAYDIWGDTVNIASRIQSVCPPNEVLISAETADRLPDSIRLTDERQVELKGRGSYRVFRADWEV